jgi:hypothetical protein
MLDIEPLGGREVSVTLAPLLQWIYRYRAERILWSSSITSDLHHALRTKFPSLPSAKRPPGVLPLPFMMCKAHTLQPYIHASRTGRSLPCRSHAGRPLRARWYVPHRCTRLSRSLMHLEHTCMHCHFRNSILTWIDVGGVYRRIGC